MGMLLSTLPKHQPAVVTGVSLPSAAVDRLSAYGLRIGAPVTVERVSPLGSLVACRVYGTLLALRPETASAITVEGTSGRCGGRYVGALPRTPQGEVSP